MKEADVRAYYQLLHHSKETEIRIVDARLWHEMASFCKSNDIDCNTQGSAFVKSEGEFEAVCKRFDGACNVYAGVNERKHLGTTDNEVVAFRTIFIDCDPVRLKDTSASQEQVSMAERTADRILDYFLKRLEAQCYAKAFSGNGWHAYFQVPEVVLTEKNRGSFKEKYSEFGSFLQKMFSSDKVKVDSVFNLSRIAKVAGTTSIKGGEKREAYFSKVVSGQNASLVDYLQLPELLPEPPTQKYSGSLSFEELLQKDEKLRNLHGGSATGYKSRSEAEFALLVKLCYYGFSQQEVWRIMERARIGKWKEASEAYRKRSYTKALSLAKNH